MGKGKTAAGPSADELVTKALVSLATADGPMRLSGKGDHPALFGGTGGAAKEAVARCQDPAAPLLVVDGKGKTATVRLTAAGFRRALAHLPEEKVGGVAKSLAAELTAAARVEFLDEVVRRTPAAAPELLPELERAAAAEKAEAEARAAEAARRREREEATRRAVVRWLELLGERRRQRVEALRRELAAEGGAVPDDRERADPPPEGRPEPSPPRPQTREDVAFRREVAGRLVSAWLESCRLDKPEGRLFLETAMANIPGFRQVGEEGERVGFDAKYHDAEAAVSTGSPVRVVRPGWVLQEEDGEYRLAAAKVSP